MPQVHTLQADDGFLDACHVLTVIRLPTGALAGSGLPTHKLLHLVELAAPPPPRPSGVGGLNVEDFCSLNGSLRGLQASIGVMARRGASRPPLRDAKLTRLLSGALGADPIRTHLLLLASSAREHAEATSEVLSFGGLARLAKLRPQVYEPNAPRALCSQLQAVTLPLHYRYITVTLPRHVLTAAGRPADHRPPSPLTPRLCPTPTPSLSLSLSLTLSLNLKLAYPQP